MRVEVSPDARAQLRHALRENSEDLLRYFERRTPSSADAADLVGDTMLQAWRRLEALPESPQRQRMWLFTIAGHTLANHRRSNRRRLNLTLRLREELKQQPAMEGADASAVRDAVLRLPRPQRELVMLIHWDGFAIVEAAELIGINASTARSRYAAARTALKSSLSEHADY